jgi:hypothetical protein
LGAERRVLCSLISLFLLLLAGFLLFLFGWLVGCYFRYEIPVGCGGGDGGSGGGERKKSSEKVKMKTILE